MLNAPVLASSGAAALIIVYLAFVILIIAEWWVIFSKAGRPGWAAIIPIYNIYVMCKVAGKPGWWVILMFIPLVNIVTIFMLYIALAKSFGRTTIFGVFMVLLSIIFAGILAFGSATYQGPVEA